MSQSTFTLDPAPVLFDVSTTTGGELPARIERVALEHIELAENPRREISDEGIDRLAKMLCASGQLVPCIGWRPDPDRPTVILYDGQRRYLAAKASHGLAGSEYMRGLAEPVRSLIVLLLDHAPTPEEIRRIQAHCQQREELTLSTSSSSSPTAGRPAPDCATTTGSPPSATTSASRAKRAHNLRRQLTLPETIRTRVAERPSGEQISVTMANRLADMHEIAPQLTEAVAKRITSSELHDKALRDLGAFVHRTVVEDEHTYAVRIDDGALLDAAEQVDHARTAPDRRRPTAARGDPRLRGSQRLDRELDALAARARARALQAPHHRRDPRPRAQRPLRVRARPRRRTSPPVSGSSTPPSCSTSSTSSSSDGDDAAAREEAYFAGARLDDDELRDAAAEDEQRRAQARARHAEATRSNLGLGHDIRAGLIEPTDAQLHALREIVCRLLVRHYRELIAYGAGWTDPERQQPVGDTGRHEPRQVDAIVEAELERALADPDPLRGIAQLVARWARGVRARPRRRHPHQGARHRAHGAQAPATRCPAATHRCAPPCGTSCGRCSRRRSPSSTATRSSSTRREHRRPAAHRGRSELDDLDLGED